MMVSSYGHSIMMGMLGLNPIITLSSHSLYGLNRMLDICNKITLLYSTVKKDICNKYGEDVRVTEQIFMNGRLITWHREVRHLEIFFQ